MGLDCFFVRAVKRLDNDRGKMTETDSSNFK